VGHQWYGRNQQDICRGMKLMCTAQETFGTTEDPHGLVKRLGSDVRADNFRLRRPMCGSAVVTTPMTIPLYLPKQSFVLLRPHIVGKNGVAVCRTLKEMRICREQRRTD
jgi:hypothetical protein